VGGGVAAALLQAATRVAVANNAASCRFIFS
jgi:hypothetical protein